MYNTKYSKYKWIEVDKMEFKRDDFELVRSFEDKLFLGLRVDYFDKEQPSEQDGEWEDIKRHYEENKNKEEPGSEPEPSEEELAEIEKQKAIDDLKAALKELEKPEVEE